MFKIILCISSFVVRKDMQNKHLASKLFKEVMKETNCDNVYLWADETCNQGYYNHQGYKALETLNTKAIIYKKTMKNN